MNGSLSWKGALDAYASSEGGDEMAIKTIRCHVLQSSITLVADFEDNVTQVICPEYDNGACGLKRRASSGGPLSTFVARASEDILNSRTVRCDFAPHP